MDEREEGPDQDDAAEVRPAGWYADPYERAPFRWWDGDAWTWQVSSDRRAVSWDPPPEQSAEAARGVPGLGTALFAALAGIGLAASTHAILSAAEVRDEDLLQLWLPQLGLWLPLVLACLFVSRTRGTGSLSADLGFRFTWADVGFGLAGSIAARLLAFAAIQPIAFFLHDLEAPERTQFEGFATGVGGWVSLVLIACVGAPLIEELFFRGLIQSRLVSRMGTVAGVGVSSLLFGAAHLTGWVGPVTLAYAWVIAASGVALGVIRHLTGRLGTSIVAHAFFNVQAVVAISVLISAT